MVFKLPKSFLLITNDGTRGDVVYNYFTKNKANYDFYFMLNGVDLPDPSSKSLDVISYKSPYLVYPARIARWKRQHLAIDILRRLHDKGLPMNLYLAGHITDIGYWNEIKDNISECGLESFVTYLGTVDRETLYCLYRNAIAVLSLYEHSNLGNVVIEALINGSVVLSFDDGSLGCFIESGVNGILVGSIDEAVEQIDLLCHNMDLLFEIRKSAEFKASRDFKDWSTRVEEEIQLVNSAVMVNAK